MVVPNALYRALRDGVIAGTALDVTEPEPLPADSPLLTLDNLIFRPIKLLCLESVGEGQGLGVKTVVHMDAILGDPCGQRWAIQGSNL